MKISRFLLLFLTCVSAIYSQAQSATRLPREKAVNADAEKPTFIDSRTVIARVEYTGLDIDNEDYGVFVENAVYETDFMTELRQNRMTILNGEYFAAEKIEANLKLLKGWLARRGYPQADVVVLGTKLPNDQIRLRFSVDRGPLVPGIEINFIGSKNISSDEFVEDFKKCAGNRWHEFEQRKYEHYAQTCSRQLMWSKGFSEGKILSVTSSLLPHQRLVRIETKDGVRYRIGEIKMEGENVFREKEILEMWGQKSGDVLDGRDLQNFIRERLKHSYDEKGYVQYDAEFEPEFVPPLADGLDGVVNLRIIIDEGKTLAVRRIVFRGFEPDEERILKDEFDLKEGELFTMTKLQSSVDKINKTGRFYPLDKDRDVDLRTDEEEGNIDLVIALKNLP